MTGYPALLIVEGLAHDFLTSTGSLYIKYTADQFGLIEIIKVTHRFPQ